MRLSDFIEGLTVLKPYYDDPNGYHIGAEHDEFFAWTTDRPLAPDDIGKMHSLGWSQSDVADDTYDQNIGWRAFL